MLAAGAGLVAALLGRLGAISLVLLLAGAVVGDARLEAIDAPARLVRDGASLRSRVHALGRPRPSPFGSSLEVRVAGGRLKGARLLARVPRWSRWPAGVPIGGEVALRGSLRRIDPAENGFQAHLRRRGVAGELMVDSASPTGARRGGLAGGIDRMRERSERALAAGMPRAEADLARGMVLGQDEAIAEPVRDDFRASGLAHLLAVSGQNVMLLVALALPALAAAGLGTRGRAIALLALIALYVPLAGAGPSLQRAAVMGAAGIAALAASRPSSRAYALLLAAAATLLLNPRAAGDLGWQLSFAAVAGILCLAPPLRRTLRAAVEALSNERDRRPPASPGAPRAVHRPRAAGARKPCRTLANALADGAAITVAATVATAPLVAHQFGSVPLAGLAANLLALPAVAPAMWLGMLKAAIGQAGALGVPAAALAQATAATLGAVARLPVAFIAWLAERSAELPGGQVALPLASLPALALAYAALAGAALVARRASRSLGPAALAAAARWRRLPAKSRAGLIALLAAAVMLAGAGALTAPAPPSRLTVRFLDVGQGDATLIQHPDGTAVLFDGGPPESGVARLLRRAGVRRLALLVATHSSRDHHGGLPEVLERFPVGLLLDGGDGSADPAFRTVIDAARARGVRRVRAVAPLSVRAGGLTIRILSPPPRPPGPPPGDPNPRAVVAAVSAGGFDLLLSADAESDALGPLALPDVDAMKVPHHGSSDPGLPGVLRRLRPEVAAIEVGPNGYGHPTASTLRALAAARVRTYRTDRHGTVSLTVADRGLAVDTAR